MSVFCIDVSIWFKAMILKQFFADIRAVYYVYKSLNIVTVWGSSNADLMLCCVYYSCCFGNVWLSWKVNTDVFGPRLRLFFYLWDDCRLCSRQLRWARRFFIFIFSIVSKQVVTWIICRMSFSVIPILSSMPCHLVFYALFTWLHFQRFLIFLF